MGKIIKQAVLFVASFIVICNVFGSDTDISREAPVHVYCSTGDNLSNPKVEPVDSPAAINAMFEWMSQTYGVKRIYWRGAGELLFCTDYRIGNTNLFAYDILQWIDHSYLKVKINEAAVAAARRNKIELIYYAGLFEYGSQPDASGMYLFEDKLRIEHPEWCMLDRWGERRCPGPISFSYPAARKFIIERYMKNMEDYAGMCFYTYPENYGIRYEDEFGFEPPIAEEFNKKYPDINLCKDELSKEQQEYWQQCRGKSVTVFLRELHEALISKGKKLHVILDSKEPYFPQPYWGNEIRGPGKIFLDYDNWIKEGIIDELWVQLGDEADQKRLLDELLVKCKGTKIKLVVRSVSPLSSTWREYIKSGVTPIAVITWQKNGIERFTLESTNPDTLESSDWKLRAQTLKDVASGKIKIKASKVLPLTNDHHVLVRRNAFLALSTVADSNKELISTIENGLFDTESCVRIGSAIALKKVHRIESANRIIEALNKDSWYQFKYECRDALFAIGEAADDILVEGMSSPNAEVREVCLNTLYKLVVEKVISDVNKIDNIYSLMRKTINNTPEEYWKLRCFAIDRLIGLRSNLSADQSEQLIADLTSLIENDSNVVVQLKASEGLPYLISQMRPILRARAKAALVGLYEKYGDSCRRADAAYGWRTVGNALRKFGAEGNAILEDFRKQTNDRWLAYISYQVLYEIQQEKPKNGNFNLVTKKEAIENHNNYAPAFPGWRKW